MIAASTFAALVWGSVALVVATFGYLVAALAGLDPLAALGVGR